MAERDERIERYRAMIAALEAECAAYREVLAAIADSVLPPRPASAGLAGYQRRQDAFNGLQRDRAINVRSAATWALRHHWDSASDFMSAAASILIGAETLRDVAAKALPYEPSDG